MNRLSAPTLAIGGPGMLALMLLSACKEGNPASPHPISEVSTVHILNLDGALFALEGERRVLPFSVRAFRTDGTPTAGATVSLRVESGPGAVAPATGVADGAGVIPAALYVDVPFGQLQTVVKAWSDQATAVTAVTLHGGARPAAVRLQSTPASFRLAYRQPASGTLTCQVIDSRGGGIPDCGVALQVLAGQVRVPELGNTDSAGVFQVDYALSGEWFGDLVVAATVVDLVKLQAARTASSSDKPIHLTATTALSDTMVVPVVLAAEVGLVFITPDTSVGNHLGKDALAVAATLRDADGNPVSGVPVRFTVDSPVAQVPSAALTDAQGVVRVEVRLTGFPGRAAITAAYAELGLADTMWVEVVNRSPSTGEISLHRAGTDVWSDSIYALSVRLIAADGLPVVGMATTLSSLRSEGSTAATDAQGVAWHLYHPVGGGEDELVVSAGSDPPFEVRSALSALVPPLRLGLTVEPAGRNRRR